MVNGDLLELMVNLIEPQYKELDPSYAEDGTYFVKSKKILEHIKVDGTVLSSGNDALDEHVKQIIEHHDETVNKNQNSSSHKEHMQVILIQLFL